MSFMRKTLPSRREVFDAAFGRFESGLNNLVNRVQPLTYEQRGWVRDALETAADVLRQGRRGPDTSALDQLLDNPPQNMPPHVVELVKDHISEALGLPESARESEPVRQALEQAANGVVSGPASGTARSLQQRWQQVSGSVPRKTRP